MEYPAAMGSQDLKQRLAPRAQAIVCRYGRILMAKHREGEAVYWCLPGGGLEDGESPEDGVLRELREEAHVEGRIVRQANHLFGVQGIEQYTYLVDIGDQEPALGHDPEVSPEDQILVDLQWLSLEEIPERDRAFLWQAGLMSVPGFLEEVERWGDEISYPD
jgi:8-oxo-dGTP pyrophosphatase MutT (NUDIX family)